MPIGAIVGQSMTELGWVGPLAEARLLGHWASVVGAEIASRVASRSAWSTAS